MTYPTAPELKEAIYALECACYANGMSLEANENNEVRNAARAAVGEQIKVLLNRIAVAERTVDALGVSQTQMVREHGERLALMGAALAVADTAITHTVGLSCMTPLAARPCPCFACCTTRAYNEARAKTRDL
jgi:hypothetical protein